MSGDMNRLKEWVGRRERMSDVATARPVAALNATFDRREREPAEGDAVPPGWHWLYFLETAPQSELAHDGHAKRGGFLPPVELPRRMWAGGVWTSGARCTWVKRSRAIRRSCRSNPRAEKAAASSS